MEEEAAPRCSVSELAGRFKDSAPATEKTEKPVRRRPPRSLSLPKPQEDNQEPAGGTSPLPAKTKRNSALIEKLQANLSLSPTALLTSPKSPGFRLLPPAFPPQSPGSSPVTPVTNTPSSPTTMSPVVASPITEDEGPSSFEGPPTAAEGSILSNINKSRARHSIKRRPPSRRHRMSSSGDEVGTPNEGGDTGPSLSKEPEDTTTEEKEQGGEKVVGEKNEDKNNEVKEEQKDPSTENETHEKEQPEIDAESKEEEKRDGAVASTGEEEEVSLSSRKEEEEKRSVEKHDEDSATNNERREEEQNEQTMCQTPS